MSEPTSVEAVARAVLYEGYVLWPYRRSAIKNRRRWTFGGVYPRGWSESGHLDDAWRMVTCCLVEGAADDRVTVRVRFLQVVHRGLELAAEGGGRQQVDELTVGGEKYLAWDEAREREVDLGEHRLEDLVAGAVEVPVLIEAGRKEEPLVGDRGEQIDPGEGEGWVVRTWNRLEGRIVLTARPVDAAAGAGEPGDEATSLHRLQVVIENLTSHPATTANQEGWQDGERERAVEHAFASSHTVLDFNPAGTGDGEGAGRGFVSLADPPQRLADAAESCRDACQGTWPVLAGEEGSRTTLLSSPIILEDYPRIAPESPGDLFDGGEIDQLLILNVLAMTDDERAEMAASDPKAREILERCQGLSPEEMMRLHGRTRSLGPVNGTGNGTGGSVEGSAAGQSAGGGLAGPGGLTGPGGLRPADHSRRENGASGTGGWGQGPADLGRELPPSWGELNEPVDQVAEIGGVTLRPGDRVRLAPRVGGDIMDLALTGQVAIIEGIDQDHNGTLHLAVTLESDPGRDFGESRFPGHRFFFTVDEVEPLTDEPAREDRKRVLVAGIGNVFLADDGFGVEVVKRLLQRPQPPGVDIVDYGIRGMDLVYALARDYDAAILVDAAPRGEAPGTVSVLEPVLPDTSTATMETHGMDPVKVLAMAAASGPLPETVLLVVCEPVEVLAAEDWQDARMELSPLVEAAVGPAVERVESLVAELLASDGPAPHPASHSLSSSQPAGPSARRKET